jgi:hypothetical protein
VKGAPQRGKMKDAYAIVKKTLEIPHLQPHVYTEQEYEEMKDIIHRMIKDGIVIFNSEATMEEKFI